MSDSTVHELFNKHGSPLHFGNLQIFKTLFMKNMHKERNEKVKIANCRHERSCYVTDRKLFGQTRAVSFCIIQMVVSMFDAFQVNAYLGPVCKEMWLGKVAWGAFSSDRILDFKVLNGTLNYQK